MHVVKQGRKEGERDSLILCMIVYCVASVSRSVIIITKYGSPSFKSKDFSFTCYMYLKAGIIAGINFSDFRN